MSTMPALKSQAMTVGELAPCRLGSAWKLGRSMIVSFGLNAASCALGRSDHQMADEQRMPCQIRTSP